jgi:pre-mRNA-splicing helicase BRR2
LGVNIESGLSYFDGSYRHCPLVQRFAGITAKKPMKQIELQNKLCYQYCKEQFTRKNQVIVFVHYRKETVNTGNFIMDFVF